MIMIKKYLGMFIIAFVVLIVSVEFLPVFAMDSVTPGIFKNDGKYLHYPYNLSQLDRERVIFKSDSKGEIVKVYRYDDNGNLKRIHLPKLNYSLFIERDGSKNRYYVAEAESAYRIIGGKFPDLDLQYAGGSGFSDIAVMSSVLGNIIKNSQKSMTQLEKMLRQYNRKTGKLLTEKEFNQPITMKHSLMILNGMNTDYFFDGRGNRLEYNLEANGQFKILSKSLEKDLSTKKKLDESMDGFFGVGGFFIIIGILIVLFVVILIVILILIIKFSKYIRLRRYD